VLVTNVAAGVRPCVVLDAPRLEETGAVAIGEGLVLRTAVEAAGERQWTGSARW
jgi:hypothetical protein